MLQYVTPETLTNQKTLSRRRKQLSCSVLTCLVSAVLSVEWHRNLPRYHLSFIGFRSMLYWYGQSRKWFIISYNHLIWIWLAVRGLRSGVAVRGFVKGPAAVAVGRIAPTGRTAPKAPVGIKCPKFLWFQKWFLKAQKFKNHHKNLRIIKIFWNHLPFSWHFATFSSFARKFYIVLQPWLTHVQPVHNGACQCQQFVLPE